jgi:hypothetical protein
MNIRSLRGNLLITVGRLQESLGRCVGRQDWRLAGLMRQVHGRLHCVKARRARAPAWRAARP